MSTTDSSIVRPYELTSTQFTAVARAFRNLSRLKGYISNITHLLIYSVGVFPDDDEYEVDILELRETPNNFDSQLADLVKRIKALLNNNNNNNGSDKRLVYLRTRSNLNENCSSTNDIKQMRELSLLAHQQWIVGMDMAQVLRENKLVYVYISLLSNKNVFIKFSCATKCNN
jgi:hypothetical protein